MWFRNTDRNAPWITLLREERESRARQETQVLAVMQELVRTMGKQQETVGEYLKLFTQGPAPQVRVMDDAQEAAFERLRQGAHKFETTRPVADVFAAHVVDPEAWLAEMKRSMGEG